MEGTSKMEICTIKNLGFLYNGQKKEVLQSIDLSIQEGEFIILCGQSGCGKTTLLRHLKPELKPLGRTTGSILYTYKNIYQLSPVESASAIGFVMQNPEHQIVTDKVWHELAFGLENLGIPSKEIRRRVAEMATFFGIEHLFHRESDTLSGGQKQLVNLASIMLLQPKILLLDEPTSQLDPIAASEFIDTLKKINDEFGTTILMVEHRLEEVMSLADRIVVMEAGRILCVDTPYNIADKLQEHKIDHPMFQGFPTAVRLYQAFTYKERCPMNVKEGKQFLREHFHPLTCTPQVQKENTNECIVSMKDIYFRYDKHGNDILKGIQFQVRENDICALLGSNGAGKSTILNMLCGSLKPYRGTASLCSYNILKKKDNAYVQSLAYIPQNPTTLFVKDSVEEDLKMFCNLQKNTQEANTRMAYWIEKLCLQKLLTQHPYDLSGGEQQKVALCKVLIRKVALLLLDEPTKGLDAFAKIEFGNILVELQKEGITILMVTHDVEFAASYANQVALLFDGDIISQDNPKNFFSNNNFYTTAAHKIARDFYKDAITCEEVIDLCQKSLV